MQTTFSTYLLCLLGLLYNPRIAPAQKTERLQTYMTQSERFNELYPQEKVYLHFDNTSYYIGEHIWFKAYVTKAADHTLSDLSKTLYVELLTTKGILVERKIYPIKDGCANGDFFLPEKDLNAGYYEVRAYTRWMCNWDKECTFSRIFPIFNKPWEEGNWPLSMYNTVESGGERITYDHRKAPKYEELNMSFYPEGGSLIAGISSRMAFKVTNEEGASVPIQIGKIRTRKGGESLADIQTLHDGMGMFTFTPQEKEEYIADVIYGNKRYVFDLPDIKKSGYTLFLNNYLRKRMILAVTKSPDLPSDTLGLTISCRGKVYASQILSVTGNDPVQLSIPKDKLPRGVVQITLFDSFGQILCERMAFSNTSAEDDKLCIEMDTTELNLSPYSSSKISFRLTDIQGNPQPYTSFSVSIRDGQTDIPTLCPSTPDVHLLLSSDLKGCIENPSYYFEKEDENHLKALDLLMMIQGWRRYEWTQMAKIIPFELKYKAERGISIDGTVLHLMTKKTYKNAHISYLLKGLKFDDQITDEEGQFSFTESFYGKQRVLLQTRSKKYSKRETYILLNRNFYPFPRTLEWWETHPALYFRGTRPLLSNNIESAINPDNEEIPLDLVHTLNTDSVIIRAKQKRPRVETVILDVDFLLEQMRDEGIDAPNLGQFLERFDPYYNGVQSYFDMRSGRRTAAYFHNQKPCITVCTDSKLAKGEYDPKDPTSGIINMKNLVRYGGYNQMIGYEKIILIDLPETKEALAKLGLKEDAAGHSLMMIFLHLNAVNRREEYGVRQATVYGYNQVSDFYSPQYLTGVPLNSQTRDHRRTLIWAPNLTTDQEGKSELEFYNNSSCKEFLISTNCVTKKGLIGSSYYEKK